VKNVTLIEDLLDHQNPDDDWYRRGRPRAVSMASMSLTGSGFVSDEAIHLSDEDRQEIRRDLDTFSFEKLARMSLDHPVDPLTEVQAASDEVGAEPEHTQGNGSPAQFDMEVDLASGHFDMTADARKLSTPADEGSAQTSAPGDDTSADLPLPEDSDVRAANRA
jgi:hypothetical protein